MYLLCIRGTLTTTDAEAGEGNGAKPGELLFIDLWREPERIQKFFSDSRVQAGAFTFYLQPPMSRTDRYLGLSGNR